MAESFAERWSRKERDCGLETIASTMIACGSYELPHSAAPCLSFKEAARPLPIWKVFAAPSEWSEADREPRPRSNSECNLRALVPV
jgi:hypothetical protein